MRIAIAGASGRMGHMLIQAVLDAEDLTLAVALDRTGGGAVGEDRTGDLVPGRGVLLDADQGRPWLHGRRRSGFHNTSVLLFDWAVQIRTPLLHSSGHRHRTATGGFEKSVHTGPNCAIL